MTLAESEKWFLVHTQPKSERRAELHLGGKDSGRISRQIEKTIRHARQLRTVRAPLFPRYIFIILDLGRDRWLSVRSTVGVSSLFSCEDRPIPVPEGVVEALIEHTDEANLTLFQSRFEYRAIGANPNGPFANFVGTLERLDDAGRVRVLLEMMGTAVPVALRRVRALSPAA